MELEEPDSEEPGEPPAQGISDQLPEKGELSFHADQQASSPAMALLEALEHDLEEPTKAPEEEKEPKESASLDSAKAAFGTTRPLEGSPYGLFSAELARLLKGGSATSLVRGPQPEEVPWPHLDAEADTQPPAEAAEPEADALSREDKITQPAPSASEDALLADGDLSEDVRNRFLAMGLPVAFVPEPLPGEALGVALVRSLQALAVPKLAPLAGGDVVAVVGAPHLAVEEAQELCSFLPGSLPGRFAVAAAQLPQSVGPESWIRSLDEAERFARELSRLSEVGVVAVCGSLGGRDATRARGFLEALGPAVVLAAVDACSSTSDVAAWLEQLGGVDALSVWNVEATQTPGAWIGLGIPIARLDGRAATPERWAAVLMEGVVAWSWPFGGSSEA